MAVKFNPFTGQLQIDEKGSGGGSSYIDGEVATYNDLPLDGTAALNSAWLVREASGSWFTGGSKPAGIYVRTGVVGSLRDSDYTYAGLLPSAFSDSEFKLYDEGNTTRTAQFQLSGITAGQNRVISVPDKSITLDDAGDARTPASHTHGNITNDGKLGSTAGLPVVTTTAGAVTTLALGTAGQVLRTKSDLSGVEFADPAASGVTGAASSASDVLGVSGANITGVDAGAADRLVFWDDSANKLTYLEAGSGLTISGTVMTASGGASINQAIAVGFVLN